ncbi:MAG TPA: bifunctional lysylphosphatidylglycerol flippase/synthetase MprF [bacterium]|nr:bifunctional lysylphosphatidylglycerol flippase/synthetase MprF [bacterium]
MEQIQQTRSKIIQTATILGVMVLFFVALAVLRREVKVSHAQDVLGYLYQISWRRFLAAFGLSLGSYLALSLYDVLGLFHIHKLMSYGRILLTSFIAYSFSHNMGAAPITGGGIRYRLYSAWGLTVGEAANVLVICGMTFWIGYLTMGAVFFFLEPPELPPSIHLPFNSVFSIGTVCVTVVMLYLLSAVFFKKTIHILKWKFPTPSVGIVVSQMLVGCLDWTCSGGALFLLLPPNSLNFPTFLSIYLLAQIVGFLSQVPGGLGVLETVIVLLLSPLLPASDVLGAMLAFRMVYYLIPFVMGLGAFSIYEIIRNKAGFKRALQILDRWAPDFAPHVFSILLFLGGAVLLVSDATPEAENRLARLGDLMPLPVLEGSHFLAALAGAALLVLARGLQQRLESSYVAALIALGIGVLTCLFKGFDYREALMLLALGVALLPCRRYFPRKSSVFQQRYPPFWVTAILFVLLGSIWIGVFNYHNEDYSNDLWTMFDLLGDSSRFIRAILGETAFLIIFSLITLLSPAQPETEYPTPSELDRALAVTRKSRRAEAGLALLGDKALLFNKKSDAFLMYAIEGKCWIALGDPVGPEKEKADLALKFKDLCRRHKAWTLFYTVDQEQSQFYLDAGLTVLKFSEEARVSLRGFRAEGLASSDLKSTAQRFREKADYTFEVLEPGWIHPHLTELKEVSEAWLSKNKSREKGFSVGFFREDYLQRFPLAVVRKEGKIAAFASLTQGGSKEEVAVDLLRSTAGESELLEDYLLLESMLWAKEKGHQWFNLGMAPLLDMQEGPLAPFEKQVTQILAPYHGEAPPADIRKSKEKFNPEWSPKYLVTSGNLSLQVALTALLGLIAKGNRVGYRQ